MKKFYVFNLLILGAFNLAHPVTPRLITELGLPHFMFGLFFALMAVGSYIFSPIWGGLSDYKGRKKFLMFGVFGYGIAQLGFGLSQDVVTISIFRLLAGCLSVSYIAVMMACINDITLPKARTKAMSYLSASVAMGAVIGSTLGGWIGRTNYFHTFIFQFIACLILGGSIHFFLPETIKQKKEGPTTLPLNHLKLKKPTIDFTSMLGSLIVTVTLMNIMTTSYNSTIGFFVEHELQLSTEMNGLVLSVAPLIAIAANFLINPRIATRFDDLKSLIWVTGASALTLFIWGISSNILIIIPFFLLYLIISPLALPIYQGMIAKRAENNVGEIMGVQNSARSVGMVIGSLSAGFLFDFGSRLPFLLGSFTAFACFIILILQRQKNDY